jgi:hypothetical protein
MLDKKFGFLVFVFIIPVVVGICVVSADAASGRCGGQCNWQDCLSIVRLFNTEADYRWIGDWDPRFDTDFKTHYCGVNLCDCDVRCELEFSCQASRLR